MMAGSFFHDHFCFEEEFGCEIPDDAAEKILTVKDAIKFLEDSSA